MRLITAGVRKDEGWLSVLFVLTIGVAMCGAARATAASDAIAAQRLNVLHAYAHDPGDVQTHDNAALYLPYESTIDLRLTHEHVRRVVITIHGTLRNADDYHAWMRMAARRAGAAEETALITPQFLIEADLVESGHAASDDPVLFWTNGGWKQGDRSLNTRRHQRSSRISSYAALERLIGRVHRACPNVREIVVVGHSAGGQMVNRFAAGNRIDDALRGRGVTLLYVVCDPSSYLYFCDQRKVESDPPIFAAPFRDGDGGTCPRYNRYRYGPDGLTPYLATHGIETLGRQYADRSVTYLMGALDNDPEALYLDRSCAAMLQGAHRLERGRTYHAYLAHRFGDDVHDRHRLVVVPGVGHSAPRIFASRYGRAVIFAAGDVQPVE